MNKFILALILALFFQTTCHADENVKNQCVLDDYVAIINQVTTEVQKKLTKRYNMQVVELNRTNANCVDSLELEFQILGPFPKEKLRVMLIEGIEELLTAINSNEKLRPFLKKYPFPVNEIEGGICIVDKMGELVFDPDIAIVVLLRSEVYFNTIDKDNGFEYKTTEKEDYETALKIVRGVKN